MTEATFRVAFAGPQVTVQDQGRPGLMRYGVPASGPMDRRSFAIANTALGNPANLPAIEVSRGGLVLDCLSGAISLAVIGGGFIVDVGGQTRGSWTIISLTAGQKLAIRPGPWGSWTYLAFAGQMQTAAWLGSTATHGPSGLGAGPIVTGQTLTIAAPELREARQGAVPCPVWARPRQLLRCVLGPQDRFFAPDDLRDLATARFALTDAYDRMGVRLRGPAMVPSGALGIPSEAILRGSVQVSGDGVATVLLADHQTTGGYPKIATILSDDIDGFVQCRPHDSVSFLPIAPADATDIARNRARLFAAYLVQVAKAAGKRDHG